MERRFFVTIFAPRQSALAKLQRLNLDLFGISSRKRGESSLGGLLTEANIEEVRKAGFRVEVHQEYIEQARQSELAKQAGQTEEPSPPVEIMDDKAWLEEFNRRKKVE